MNRHHYFVKEKPEELQKQVWESKIFSYSSSSDLKSREERNTGDWRVTAFSAIKIFLHTQKLCPNANKFWMQPHTHRHTYTFKKSSTWANSLSAWAHMKSLLFIIVAPFFQYFHCPLYCFHAAHDQIAATIDAPGPLCVCFVFICVCECVVACVCVSVWAGIACLSVY